MSDQWGQPPQQGGNGQQPYNQGQQPEYQGQQPYYQGQQPEYPGQQPGYQGQQPEYQGQQPGYQGQQPYYQGQQPYNQGGPPVAGQPAPTQPMGYYGQPQQPSDPYAQQQFAPAPPPAPGGSRKRPIIISSIVALAVIGGAAGIYFATKPGNSNNTARAASTSAISPTGVARSTATAGAQTPTPSAGADTQSSAAGAGASTDLLSTNQVCPAYLALETSLSDQMGQIQDEADGLRVFGSFQPKFDALAAGTPPGQFQTEIHAVAGDIDAMVAYIKANPHMSKPAPPAFDTELNTFQNDADAVDNNCDPLGTPTS